MIKLIWILEIKDLIEDNLYQIIDQINEKKMTTAKFYSKLLNEIHPFYDGNCRRCKMLFANDDIIRQIIWKNLNGMQSNVIVLCEV